MSEALPHPVRAQFEALLLERVFEPLEEPLGDFGALVVAACARSVAERFQS